MALSKLKPKTTEIDNRPKPTIISSRRRDNHNYLYQWVRGAKQEFRGTNRIDNIEADFIATYINNKLPSNVRLGVPDEEADFINSALKDANSPWPYVILMIFAVIIFGAIYLLIPGN